MSNISYFDTLSIQEELELYTEGLRRAEDRAQELEVKRVFYMYLTKRNSKELQFIREILDLEDSREYNILKKVYMGKLLDASEGKIVPIMRQPDYPTNRFAEIPTDAGFNIGRLPFGTIATIPVPKGVNPQNVIESIMENIQKAAKLASEINPKDKKDDDDWEPLD